MNPKSSGSKPSLTPQAFLRRVGFVIFFVSFAMPDADLGENGIVWLIKCIGFGAFLGAPFVAANNLFMGDWQHFVAGIVLGVGWLMNFTVFISMPKELAWFPILAVWLVFLVFMLGWYPNGNLIAGFLPFYFWAVGISLCHGAVYFERTRAN